MELFPVHCVTAGGITFIQWRQADGLIVPPTPEKPAYCPPPPVVDESPRFTFAVQELLDVCGVKAEVYNRHVAALTSSEWAATLAEVPVVVSPRYAMIPAGTVKGGSVGIAGPAASSPACDKVHPEAMTSRVVCPPAPRPAPYSPCRIELSGTDWNSRKGHGFPGGKMAAYRLIDAGPVVVAVSPTVPATVKEHQPQSVKPSAEQVEVFNAVANGTPVVFASAPAPVKAKRDRRIKEVPATPTQAGRCKSKVRFVLPTLFD